MRKKTQEEFVKEIQMATNDAFDVVGTYEANNIPVALRCHTCGNIIYKRPSKMICTHPEGCYICNKKNKHKTTESFRAEVEAKFPGVYDIIGEYKKAREHITVCRLECGHIYDITPDNLLRGKGCPLCSRKQSSYMNKTESILNSLQVRFKKEKYFEDCVFKRRLPFDYYLLDYHACIEVDGEFHYVSQIGENDLDMIRTRDAIKTEYCRSNGIPLLRLPYFQEEKFQSLIVSFILSLSHANTEISA